MLAVVLKSPVLAISSAEAAILAEAAADVSEEFDVPISRKAIVIGNMLGAIMAIHGPRVFLMVAAGKMQKRAPAMNTAESVRAPVQQQTSAAVLKPVEGPSPNVNPDAPPQGKISYG